MKVVFEYQKRRGLIARVVAWTLLIVGTLLLFIAVMSIAALPTNSDDQAGRVHELATLARRDTGHFATKADLVFMGTMAVLGIAALWTGAEILIRFEPKAFFRMPKGKD